MGGPKLNTSDWRIIRNSETTTKPIGNKTRLEMQTACAYDHGHLSTVSGHIKGPTCVSEGVFQTITDNVFVVVLGWRRVTWTKTARWRVSSHQGTELLREKLLPRMDQTA